MILVNVGSGCLGHIFNIPNRFLPKIPIILYILFNNFCPGELILRKIGLDAILGTVVLYYYLFTKHVFFRIKFPFIVTIFLLSTFIIPMGPYIQGLNLRVFFNLNIIGCNHILCDVIIEVGFISIGKIRIINSIRELVIS